MIKTSTILCAILLVSALPSFCQSCPVTASFIQCGGIYRNPGGTFNSSIGVKWTGSAAASGCAGSQTDYQVDIGQYGNATFYGTSTASSASEGPFTITFSTIGDGDFAPATYLVRVRIKGLGSDPNTFSAFAQTTCHAFQDMDLPPTDFVLTSQGGTGTAEPSWPAVVPGDDWWADPNCAGVCASQTGTPGKGSSCNTACTDSTPCSWQCAITKPNSVADRIILHAGEYTRSVQGAGATSATARAGDATNPIQITSDPNAAPYAAMLTNDATVIPARFLDIKHDWWWVHNVTLKNSNTDPNSSDDNAAVIKVDSAATNSPALNARISDWICSTASNTNAVYLGNRAGRFTIFETGVCAAPAYEFIHQAGSGGSIVSNQLTIRGNDLSSGGGDVSYQYGIHVDGGQGPVEIIGNKIHDLAGLASGVKCYLGCYGGVFRRNILYNLATAAPANLLPGIDYQRVGMVTNDHNTYYALTGSSGNAIGLNQRARFTNNHSNIMSNGKIAIGDYANGNQSFVIGTNIAHTLMCGNSTGGIVWSANYASIFSLFGRASYNCDVGTTACSGSACDPLFVNAAGGDFHLVAGSAAIGLGDPASPAPTGAATNDAGALAYGAIETGPLYASYSAGSGTTDTTPQLCFTRHNQLDQYKDAIPGEFVIDPNGVRTVQSSYRCQIDTTCLFNSQASGSHPLLDTGVVSTTSDCYHVGTVLALGNYCARCQTASTGSPSRWSAWSDVFPFTVQ